ncbi:hypothetical protein SteCoe_23884 [Stentor coeruleus]|uniref:Protein kinase domain-containing protein n=1 Tax=Stentor coeruleus TaxID=5963 RepID=A0A1R2BIV7_9CILI|nr:hypothetical protein SteCoe_23884 [Stentor coeruleus]
MSEIIRKTKETLVKKFWYKPKGKYAIEKTLLDLNEGMLELKMQEIESLKLVQDCECCIKYYDSSITKNKNNLYELKIITEYCEKGDLDNMLKERKMNRNPFTNSELFTYFETLINYFSILQKHKIAHRDIKLENIFVTNDNKLKIGDFGCATDQLEREIFTIQGTPNYLSPALYEGYMRSYTSHNIYVKHDPFKSDVFSLGMVFLYMATFNSIKDSYWNERFKLSDMSEKIEKISNPKIKSLISVMLQQESNSRPDFILLKEFFQNLKDDVCCNECHNSVIKEIFFCKDCNFVYHKHCKNNIKCPGCEQVLLTKCESCGVQLTASLNCMNGHQVCEYCKTREMRYIECKYCIGFMILDGFKSQIQLKPSSYACFYCKNMLELYGDGECYFCGKCNISYCKNCKQIHCHNELGPKTPNHIFCKCGTICVKDIWDDIFYFCQNCFENASSKKLVYLGNCCVCLDSNTSHISCMLNSQTTCFANSA